jgi:hypothetical protein
VNLNGALIGFKKQPSQMVARKRNEALFQKTFVGQVSLGNVDKDFVDDRNFATTYNEYGSYFDPSTSGNSHISTPTSHE